MNKRLHKTILREKVIEEKTEFSPGKIIGCMVFEQGENNIYIVYDLTERNLVIPSNPKDVWDSITFENVTYRPLKKLLWKPLPSTGFIQAFSMSIYELEEHLWKEIKDFIKAYVDFAEDFQYDICTAWVLHTWRIENFSVTPYLFFYGPKGSGKTRAMEILSSLCYRSIMSPSCSGASLMRLAERYCPSVFLDEAQIYSKEEKAEVNALLNAGYKRGQKAIRTFIMDKTGEEEIRCYEPFCPKGLAGTRELLETVADRSLFFVMSRNIRPIPLQVNEDKKEALTAKLFVYRLKCLSENRGLIPIEIPEQYLTYGRIIEKLYPLIVVAPAALKPLFYEHAVSLEKERGIEEALSLEARVFNALIKAHKEHEILIPLQVVADFVNLNLSDKERLSNRSLGSIISKLGFKKRYYQNRTHISWSEIVAKRLERRYPKDVEESAQESAQEQQQHNSHSKIEDMIKKREWEQPAG